MKTKYLLLAGLVVVLGSCSTAYRSGQTPDDVYYSPAPAPTESYIVTNNNDRQSYQRNAEEREIRRAIRNPIYRNSISLGIGTGFGYGYNSFYNPYGFSSFYDPFYGPYYGSFGKGYFNPFGYSPYGYSPYYGGLYSPFYGSPIGGYYGSYFPPAYYYPVAPGKVKVNTNTGPRRYNLSNYGNTSNPRSSHIRGTGSAVTPAVPQRAPVRTFSNSRVNERSTSTERRQSGVGKAIRRAFTPSDNDSYRAPSNNSNRRYTPPASNNRSNDYRPSNTTPTRTFERSSAPPVRSTPPASNSSRTPVRTFRNN